MSFKVKIAFLIFPLITLFFANASVATQCRERPSTCNDSDLCIYAFTNQFTMWDMKYRGHVIEAKRRGYFPSSVPVYKYGCGAVKNKSVNVMRYYFTKLVRDERLIIQKILKEQGFYKNRLDGLFGAGTASALNLYNKKYLKGASLKETKNVVNLLKTILKSDIVESFQTTNDKIQIQKTFKVASGTGFYVSGDGHIMTNYHVIEGCKGIKVHTKGRILETLKIADDKENDLALLKISESPEYVFSLSEESPYPLQEIVVVGYPFGERLSSTPKFTQGIVSSVAGLGNNYSQIQIDAALQPGNSGGPIMDSKGNVVGVAVAKLSLKKILKDFGVVPENTNFGVKATAIKNLMEGNRVSFKSPNKDKISRRELSKRATDGTTFLSCWMTSEQIKKFKTKKVLFSDLD